MHHTHTTPALSDSFSAAAAQSDCHRHGRPLAALTVQTLLDCESGNLAISDVEFAAMEELETAAQRAIDLSTLSRLELLRRELEVIHRAERPRPDGEDWLPMSSALDMIMDACRRHCGAGHAEQLAAATTKLAVRALTQPD
jgi:hypothetical protein